MQENNKLQPEAAAAAMLKLTMTSIDKQWGVLQPVFAAFTTDAVLTRELEDTLLQELYVAVLALELYDLPHVFASGEDREIESELLRILQSGDFAPLRLAEPIRLQYLPRLREIRKEETDDMGAKLLEEAVGILYDRLPLPLKPSAPQGSFLWSRLMQAMALWIGKWPAIVKGFAAAPPSRQ
ncbi:hypothetical protein PAECIP111802_04008 [Paenibacillus allorhizosphaerae]|uniref:Uncharacterized protein n=2 Tax=Paenibacillus allorhizosphaerae TaxID=2849866 RepID=A0ABM8VKS8_9BACL|nr:hypothetical protein PAECIP111802_04008 [Paenibacillus allorhizosphaerae]